MEHPQHPSPHLSHAVHNPANFDMDFLGHATNGASTAIMPIFEVFGSNGIHDGPQAYNTHFTNRPQPNFAPPQSNYASPQNSFTNPPFNFTSPQPNRQQQLSFDHQQPCGPFHGQPDNTRPLTRSPQMSPPHGQTSLPNKRGGAHSSSPENKRKKTEPAKDYSQVVKQNLETHARTGQACDRCKVRKIRCDEGPNGCVQCIKHNTPCLTTDRTTKESHVRGHAEVLQRRIRALEQLLLGNGINIVPYAEEQTVDNLTEIATQIEGGLWVRN